MTSTKDKKQMTIKERCEAIGKRWEDDGTFERNRQMIHEGVNSIKDEISKQPVKYQQKVFSFVPYSIARTSPFFPIRSNDPRPYDELVFENPWGRITISGKKLCIRDETILLSILVLVAKSKSETIETTPAELLRFANISKGKNPYKAISDSIDRLIGTKIRLDMAKDKGSKKTYKMVMVNTILSGGTVDEKNGKIKITINPYFMEAYMETIVAYIDLNFRNELKGDITKAVYRFYESQKGDSYECHILTLAKAVNIDLNLSNRRIRDRIRKANRELKAKGYLSKHVISKTDVLTIWEDKNQLKK